MRIYRFVFLCLCVLFSSCSHAEQKEIYAKDIIKQLAKGKNITITNKIIMDDLDFTAVDNPQPLNSTSIQDVVKGNVFFVNCVFMGKVTACDNTQKIPIYTKFNENLVFQQCDFRGECDFQMAVVMGASSFVQSKFRKKANFNNFVVLGKDTYFSEIEAEDSFSMNYASFGGNFFIMDGKFQKDLSLQNATINGKLLANGLLCSANAEFDMISVHGRAIFNYSQVEKQASFIQSRFFDDADFIGIKFAEFTYENAYFYGLLRFDDKEYPCSRKYEELLKNE